MRATALSCFLLTSLVVSLPKALAAQPEVSPDEYYRAPSTVQGKTVFIPTGTTFEGRIDAKIGSSISRPGQRFNLTMSSPVLGNGVDVLIPAGTQILGEVVEAIPSSRLPHHKGEIKPTGKLRIQISGLRFPDGQSYPLVATLVGEGSSQGRNPTLNPNLGGGIGYVGSAASFEAVAPGAQSTYRGRGRGLSVVTREQMMQDPLYGQDRTRDMSRYSQVPIRSLVRRGQELYIDQGSPLSVRLDAPFKMVLNPATPSGGGSSWDSLNETGKRFSKDPQPSALTPAPKNSAGTPATASPPPQAPPVDNSF